MTEKRCTELIPAAAYARFSSERQHETSIEAQIAAIQDFSRQNGYKIIATYIDRAKSGTSTDRRDEFKKMLSDSENGDFAAVIVAKLDRFARNLSDCENCRDILLDNGVELISAYEKDSDDPLMRGIYAGLAQRYVMNLSHEVMKGHKVKANKCLHNGGTPPLGFDVDPETERLIINEHEAQAIRLIYSLYLQNYSYREMAEILNAKGFKTKEGNDFNNNSFHDLIRNKKYCGYYIYNQTCKKNRKGKRNKHKYKSPEEIICIKGGAPAIISEETYNRAMDKMESNRSRAGAYRAKRDYLLSGLIFCGLCERPMQGSFRKSGNGYSTRSYRCCHRKEECSNKEIQQDSVEALVLDLLETLIFNTANIPKIIDGIRKAFEETNRTNFEQIDHLNILIENKSKKLQNIKAAIMTGFMEDDFREEMLNLKEDISVLEEERDRLTPVDTPSEVTEESLRSMITMFSDKIKSRNISDCKRFIQDFVDSVIVFQDKVEVNLKIPASSSSLIIRRTVSRQFLPTVKEHQNTP